MYYKVIYNDKVIDVLGGLNYVKYQKKHDRMVFCEESEAQAILSSDGENVWHIEGLYDLPIPGYYTVCLEKIDEHEYKQLKVSNVNISEDIGVIDRFVKALINKEVGQLAESLKRLYGSRMVEKEKVIEFCNRNGIAEDVTNYIFEEDE